MMDWLKRHLIKIGLVLIIGGFLFELFFAGVPYQDPTEEMVIQYNRNETIAMTVMQLGLAVLIIGILIKIFTKRKKNVY